MDDQQQRIAEDLKGAFEGDLLFDPLSCMQYASDGSLHQIRPLGVARPRNRDDVALLAHYAHDQRIPLIARGSGTGLAGGCLGAGIVVDFSRYMRTIERIDDATVRVQAGVIREHLNRELRKIERYFPPIPAARPSRPSAACWASMRRGHTPFESARRVITSSASKQFSPKAP